jgi:hypothetical protein
MNSCRVGLVCLAVIWASWTPSAAFAQGMGHGGWHISQYTDKLTDKMVTRGARQYDVNNYSVQVEVLCSGRNLSYSFATYKSSDGSPEPLRQKIGLFGPTVPSTLRLDNEEAVSSSTSINRYSNVFTLNESTSSDIESMGAIQVALAKRFLLNLELQTGSALVEIDQTDQRLKFVLAQCVKATDLGRRQRFWAEKRLRQQQTERQENQAAQQEADRKAAALAAEKAEDEKYNMGTEGMHFRSQGSCSFDEYGQVTQSKCDFLFPSNRPESADRMFIFRQPNQNESLPVLVYRFRIVGDTAYASYSGVDGTNFTRIGQLKYEGGCWVGDSTADRRICFRYAVPRFQP